MAMIGATAAAEDIDVRQAVDDGAVFSRQLHGIAGIQFLRLVQFRMTATRSIAAQTTDALHPAAGVI